MSKYSYNKIKLIEPTFDSPVTDLIIELDHLRKKRLGGSTHPKVFFQLKDTFHYLESIGSARIEGNHTTIAEFVESKIDKSGKRDEKIKEIENIEKTMDFIEKTIDTSKIDENYIRQLHKLTVRDLSPNLEGDRRPGKYRMSNNTIAGSEHIPPDYTKVPDYMEELSYFINKNGPPKHDLLKIALTHHRLVWIHPFSNGNGRTVRLLTYAQLVKSGFRIKSGRIINPNAIFCSNREKYYKLLSKADSGSRKDLLGWTQYVLNGLKDEIKKIDRLLNYEYLSKNILVPAIGYSLDRKIITPLEANILKVAIKKQLFMANDLKKLFPNTSSAQLSRYIKRLKDKNMIEPLRPKSRKYLLNYNNNILLRGVIKMLDEHGFTPLKNEV